MTNTFLPITALVLAAFAAGCVTTEKAASSKQTAVAVLSPAQGRDVKGQVTFTKEKGGVRVVASVSGLTPGKHGFHIHEKGDCSAPDFASAGGHFNPLKAPHGAPDAAQHHVGDFGNIEANQEGVARLDIFADWLSFEGTNSFVGRAVIVHEKADDLTTQPTGNAGGRWACGVIQLVSQ